MVRAATRHLDSRRSGEVMQFIPVEVVRAATRHLDILPDDGESRVGRVEVVRAATRHLDLRIRRHSGAEWLLKWYVLPLGT